MGFKKGDRVLASHPPANIEEEKATVLEIQKHVTKNNYIAVEFDRNVGYHSCDDTGRPGHCIYVKNWNVKPSLEFKIITR